MSDQAPAMTTDKSAARREAHRRPLRAGRVWIWLLAGIATFVYNVPETIFQPVGRGEMVNTGYRTIDHLFYFACARRAAEEGLGGLFYANPNAFEPATPRCYSQLFFVITGWLWKLTGASFPLVDWTQRLVFGVLFLGLAGECVLWRFGDRRWFYPLIGVLFFGGGGAWIVSSIYTLGMWAGPLAGDIDFDRFDRSFWGVCWLDQFRYYEGLYGTWGMNLFRRLWTSQQVFYHTIFYAGWLCVLKGRWRGAFVASALLWWAHPFTALDFALPLAATTILMGLVHRERPPLPRWGPAAGSLALLGAGLAYYMLWLPWADPLHEQVEHQMRGHGHFLAEWKLVPALGVLGLAPILLLRRRLPWQELPVLANLSLLVCVFGLTFHHRVLGLFGIGGYQPLHFEQSYLFFSLMFLTADVFARGRPRPGVKPPRPGAPRRRWRMVLIVLACLSLFPDNIVFYSTYVINRAKTHFQSASVDEMRLLRRLGEIPGHRRVLFFSPLGSYHLGALGSVITPHHYAIGHPINSPDYKKRCRMIFHYYATGDLTPWRPLDPEIVVVPPDEHALFRALALPQDQYRLLDEAGGYEIHEIGPPAQD